VVIIRQGVIHEVPPAWIRDLASPPSPGPGLGGARLRDLALALADCGGLRVCVITYDDGTCELQVLHAGPAGTADPARFTVPAREALSQIRSIAGDRDLQAAADLIHDTLCRASTRQRIPVPLPRHHR
jgi:hypothetical protein